MFVDGLPACIINVSSRPLYICSVASGVCTLRKNSRSSRWWPIWIHIYESWLEFNQNWNELKWTKNCFPFQIEARSVDHFKKLNIGMENKIVELQRKLDSAVSTPLKTFTLLYRFRNTTMQIKRWNKGYSSIKFWCAKKWMFQYNPFFSVSEHWKQRLFDQGLGGRKLTWKGKIAPRKWTTVQGGDQACYDAGGRVGWTEAAAWRIYEWN